jgi:hypothetical protein
MGRRDRCRVSQHRGRSRDASGARILGSRSLRRTACVRFQSHVGCRIRGTADVANTESRTCLTRDRPPPVCVPRLRPLIRPSSLRCRSDVRNPMVEIVSESRIRATRTSTPAADSAEFTVPLGRRATEFWREVLSAGGGPGSPCVGALRALLFAPSTLAECLRCASSPFPVVYPRRPVVYRRRPVVCPRRRTDLRRLQECRPRHRGTGWPSWSGCSRWPAFSACATFARVTSLGRHLADLIA